MPDSIREQAVQALETLLATITTVGGYNTNLGNKIYRGSDRALEVEELPGAIIVEGQESSDSEVTMDRDHHYLNISIEARKEYADTENYQQEGNKMLADIIKVIGTDPDLGGLVIDITNQGNIIDRPEAEAQIAGVDIALLVHYRTQHLDPYN